MSTETFWYFEEYYGNAHVTSEAETPGWITCGALMRWSHDQCREKVMERKIVSPRSKLRIVKLTREVWSWRERAKSK